MIWPLCYFHSLLSHHSLTHSLCSSTPASLFFLEHCEASSGLKAFAIVFLLSEMEMKISTLFTLLFQVLCSTVILLLSLSLNTFPTLLVFLILLYFNGSVI